MEDPRLKQQAIRNEAMREMRREYVAELHRRMRDPQWKAYSQGIALVATWIDRGDL